MKRVQLDCRRMLCPMPVIKVQNQALDLEAGDEIEAICTDPGVLHDIPAWSRINGYAVLETKTVGSEYIVVIAIDRKED